VKTKALIFLKQLNVFKGRTMTNLDKIEIFKLWFSNSGHWIYPSRAAAVNAWANRGIENLPDAPQAVGHYPEIYNWTE
jgi:hypothetical protein